MKISLARTAVLLAAAAVAAGPIAAQQRDPRAGIPPHVRAQLWPERPLSPEEQELKDRVIVLRDTVAVLDGSAALLQRQQRGNTGAGLLRSSGRRIATNCAAGHRAAVVMQEYGKGLTTDNVRWGDKAVQTFRSSVGRLVGAMAACEADLAKVLAAQDGPDGARLKAVAQRVQVATADYTNAVNGLLNTLEIRVDPRGSSRQGR